MRYGPCKPVLTHTARAIRVVYRSCEFMSHLSHPLYTYARAHTLCSTGGTCTGSGHIRHVVIAHPAPILIASVMPAPLCRDVLRGLVLPAFRCRTRVPQPLSQPEIGFGVISGRSSSSSSYPAHVTNENVRLSTTCWPQGLIGVLGTTPPRLRSACSSTELLPVLSWRCTRDSRRRRNTLAALPLGT